jgi:hypothetical protein
MRFTATFSSNRETGTKLARRALARFQTYSLTLPQPAKCPQWPRVLPGLLCCFSAFVLFVFARISGNVWGAISFLDTTVNGRVGHFGVWVYGYQ